jgi:hypothetical protein
LPVEGLVKMRGACDRILGFDDAIAAARGVGSVPLGSAFRSSPLNTGRQSDGHERGDASCRFGVSHVGVPLVRALPDAGIASHTSIDDG